MNSWLLRRQRSQRLLGLVDQCGGIGRDNSGLPLQRCRNEGIKPCMLRYRTRMQATDPDSVIAQDADRRRMR